MIYLTFIKILQTLFSSIKVFPKAIIICSLRFQTDWLISCYRESIHEHHYQSVDSFLELHEEKCNNFVHNNFKSLNFEFLVNNLIKYFKKNNVNIIFYETLKSSKQLAVNEMAKILKLNKIKIIKDDDLRPNRGYSALAIKLSIIRFKLFKFLGLNNIFVHRPIKFFGNKSIPAGHKSLSMLSHEKYWNDYFLRDNEEIRKDNYPNLTLIEKIKKEFT